MPRHPPLPVEQEPQSRPEISHPRTLKESSTHGTGSRPPKR
ncbi:hypothetical protein KCH_62780 [Kitasatospora cheerisanensis KCTC 2395]|uniref:Uncharacterized protein n=1 Tax=Kitasatospora cheerisanensis KCTC 2395 TaxID=1348663 RepID=A0A066YV40_9ACTN|nr:hypothetical protein KCH_62780 [Kitasatospora cheerisanensis KCTC 2395]